MVKERHYVGGGSEREEYQAKMEKEKERLK